VSNAPRCKKGSSGVERTRGAVLKPGAGNLGNASLIVGRQRSAEAATILVQFAMDDYVVRAATLDDLPSLTNIYNYYVVNTAITFDLQTFTAATRRGWFDDHAETGPYRLLVATDAEGECLGYASSS